MVRNVVLTVSVIILFSCAGYIGTGTSQTVCSGCQLNPLATVDGGLLSSPAHNEITPNNYRSPDGRS